MMIYNDVQYNDLIKNSEWEKLANSDILSYFYIHKDKITLSREFFLKFFLEAEYFAPAIVIFSKQNNRQSDFMESFITRANEMNITDYDFWGKYIDLFTKTALEKYLRTAFGPTGKIFNWTDKNTEYARYLINNIDKVSVIRERVANNALKDIIGDGVYFGLSPEEKPKFKYVFNTNTNIELEKPEQLLEILGSVKEVIDFCNTHIKIKSGAALQNIPQEEIEQIISNSKPGDDGLIDILAWYKHNPQATISDKFLNIIKKKLTVMISSENIFGNLTKKQIQDHIGTINFSNIVTSGKFSLGEISNLYDGRLIDISSYAFFRDDEILAHPNLFSPDNIVYNNNAMYVSKETFAVLKKYWKGRKRYVDNLGDYNFIVPRMINDRKFTIDYFFYLIGELKPSNKEILESIKRISHDSKFKNIQILRKLNLKFKS